MRRAAPLVLSGSDRASLEELASVGSGRARRQARSLLLSADGLANDEIGQALEISGNTVRTWRRLYEQDGILGLGIVAKGRGRKRTLSEETVAEVVRLTLDRTSAGGSARWTTR